MGWFLMLCDGSTLLEITGEAKDLIKLDGGHPGWLGEGREEGFREGDGGREGGVGGDSPREVLIRVRECKSCRTLEITVLV